MKQRIQKAKDCYSREELAWAAGFFDGEGCTSWGGRNHTKWPYRYPIIVIGQSSNNGVPDVLKKFQMATGIGSINGPMKAASPNRKPKYAITATGFERVQAIIAMLWEWLSEAKREQAVKVLLAAGQRWLEKHRPVVCKHGHPQNDANIYIKPSTGARQCLPCKVKSEQVIEWRRQRRRRSGILWNKQKTTIRSNGLIP